MRILGISGSLRRGSHNLTPLGAAATQLQPNGVFEEYRELAAIPAYNEDLDTASAPRPCARSDRRSRPRTP
jgi:chromate reductase